MQKPREIAVSLLLEHAQGRQYLEDLFELNTAKNALSPEDRGLLQEITFGCVRWQGTLDWLIARKTEGRTQKPALQIILRLGLYQLLWLERIPPHAAVHEMVEIAKKRGFGPQSGFINAVLRGYARELDASKALLANLKAEQPAIGYSHPEWLVQKWQAQLGPDATAKLLAWNNQPPPTYARVNRLKSSAADLRALWEQERVEPKLLAFAWSPGTEVYELLRHPPLASLESFRSGAFYVQDPSTLLAVEQLDPKPGERILDLCAAPGGKTTFIAQKMSDCGTIVAMDTSAERLKLVEQNCRRLGIKSVQTRLNIADAGSDFDRVLVDAPCSNTGVMRRRVDLRWRVRAEEIARLAELQLKLLQSAAPLLKPGGTLVYSTCSLEPEENEQITNAVAQSTQQWKFETQRRLSPFADAVDGAFVARFTKLA